MVYYILYGVEYLRQKYNYYILQMLRNYMLEVVMEHLLRIIQIGQ